MHQFNLSNITITKPSRGKSCKLHAKRSTKYYTGNSNSHNACFTAGYFINFFETHVLNSFMLKIVEDKRGGVATIFSEKMWLNLTATKRVVIYI